MNEPKLYCLAVAFEALIKSLETYEQLNKVRALLPHLNISQDFSELIQQKLDNQEVARKRFNPLDIPPDGGY